ncbi:phosphate regulon sensor histidine kinase, putative [Oceanicola granulosus HTCC2516]|uniref:histidine kinase n=1 Tax=Oceanicola granulosus (strain ATCC BAA-861 / DSM 15982 / KCTC 12143 / HTCC2516) TaxID=314256 RepID=Q2CE53_OCEGH|nr:ATP-binding protein [Oceanicola granulosus]EAR51007.1 phosphate regulon sensor histidine kinase, putative [Oceanicola granulosus HTCC2516]
MSLSPLSAMLDALPLPALLISSDERVCAINARARALLGTDGLGRHYISALRQPAVLDAVEQCFADGRERTTRYLGVEGGRDTTWRVTSAAAALEQGRGVLLSFEDITALEEAGQMRRDFVANVSHELRTPLTALVGFVETLRGPAKDDAAARERFLGIMEKEAGRMARLVEDLLSLSRVEEEERLRPATPLPLADLVRDVAELFRPLAARNGLELVVRVPDAPFSVPGDAGQVRQVLNNLLENAIKYGTGGGRVELTLSGPRQEPSLRGEGVRLAVRDHGEGIDSHHLARLTERFYRVDTHRSREVGGTGLGLAIVKHIVNRHRGRLRIESERGKGSRFTVILPTA